MHECIIRAEMAAQSTHTAVVLTKWPLCVPNSNVQKNDGVVESIDKHQSTFFFITWLHFRQRTGGHTAGFNTGDPTLRQTENFDTVYFYFMIEEENSRGCGIL